MPRSSEEYKYTVSDLSNELGIEPASVRVKLRNAGEKKAGQSYGWNSQKEFNEVVKRLRATPARASANGEVKRPGRPKKEATAEAPVKGKKAKKPTPVRKRRAAAESEATA